MSIMINAIYPWNFFDDNSNLCRFDPDGAAEPPWKRSSSDVNVGQLPFMMTTIFFSVPFVKSAIYRVSHGIRAEAVILLHHRSPTLRQFKFLNKIGGGCSDLGDSNVSP